MRSHEMGQTDVERSGAMIGHPEGDSSRKELSR